MRIIRPQYFYIKVRAQPFLLENITNMLKHTIISTNMVIRYNLYIIVSVWSVLLVPETYHVTQLVEQYTVNQAPVVKGHLLGPSLLSTHI